MRFKTLIVTVLILAFAVSAFAADLAVTVNARGTTGDYDWARGTIVWSSTTYSATDKIHARALGVPMIGFLQMMPYGAISYIACPEAFTSPKDSIAVSIYINPDDSTGVALAASGDIDGTFTYFVISK